MEGNWNHPNNSGHNRPHVTVPGVFTESTQYPGLYQDMSYRMNHPQQYSQQQQQQPQQHHPVHSVQQSHQVYNGYPNVYHHQQQHQQNAIQQQQQRLQQHHMQQQQHHQQSFQAQMAKSSFRFNADARAFVPSQPQQHSYYQHQQANQYSDNYQSHSYANQNQQNQHQQPQQMYYESNVIDAFAQFGQQMEQYNPSTALYNQMLDCKAASLLNEIQVGLEQLLSEGEDDSGTWSTAIRHRFENAEMDEESKKVAVKLIIEMAYSMEPNMIRRTDPQYTLGCLIQSLARDIPNFTRNTLLSVLQEYHQQRNILENDSQVLLAVFYAELFIKVTLENGSRIEQIGDALCDQLMDITRLNATDAYMKSVMRIFKLTGAELDIVPALKEKVNEILTRMGGFAKGAPSLSESIKVQILTLVECRIRGWDRAPVSKVVATPSSNNYQSEDDDSFINELTEDERQFLESQIDMLESKDGEEDLDEQEVMNEFGKFVKEEIERAEDQKTSDMFSNLQMNDDKEKST